MTKNTKWIPKAGDVAEIQYFSHRTMYRAVRVKVESFHNNVITTDNKYTFLYNRNFDNDFNNFTNTTSGIAVNEKMKLHGVVDD